jgi:hypothetical protein
MLVLLSCRLVCIINIIIIISLKSQSNFYFSLSMADTFEGTVLIVYVYSVMVLRFHKDI